MLRNLSLLQRLLLALIPGVIIAVPIAIGHGSGDYPISPSVTAVIYFGLFGALVLAPFIRSRSGIVLRAFLLSAVAPIIFGLVSLFVSFIQSFTGDWSISRPSIWAAIIAEVFVFHLLMAILLAAVAPLNTNRRFWALAGVTGGVTGALCAVLYRYFFCLFWCDWTELLLSMPLFVWPLLFTTSIYYWIMHPARATT